MSDTTEILDNLHKEFSLIVSDTEAWRWAIKNRLYVTYGDTLFGPEEGFVELHTVDGEYIGRIGLDGLFQVLDIKRKEIV